MPPPAECLLGDRRTSVRRPLTGLSAISLIAFVVFFVAFLVLWSYYWFPFTPVGFKVRLLRPNVTAQRSPGIQPILVQVRFAERPVFGQRTRPRLSLHLNRKLVSRDDFETAVRKELALRPLDWPVYLEGDSEMVWADAVEVIDILQKLQAQVVLLTSDAAAIR